MKEIICTAVIVAAGSGKRMGTKISKQFLPLVGREILAHTVDKFEAAEQIRDIVLVTGTEALQDVISMAREYAWKKVVSIVVGGKERQDSVYNGLRAVSADTDIILIHDGVRPFVTEEILNRSIETALEMGGCVAGVPAKDTIKVCDAEQTAIATPDRNTLWQVQTPQTFRRELILNCYEKAKENGFIGTDDASLVEYCGYPVKVILGDYRNIKITTQEDLLIGEAFLQAERMEMKKAEQAAEAAEAVPIKKAEKTEKAEAKQKVVIYTDGACSGNPGAGGYGVVLLHGGNRKELSAGYRKTTNNRMEALAVIKGLEALKKPCKVDLYSDSKYVVDAIEKGWVHRWKKNGWMRTKTDKASNVDLWERMLELLEKHEVSFIWVKGHANNPENERCDELARMAIQAGDLMDDEGYGIL